MIKFTQKFSFRNAWNGSVALIALQIKADSAVAMNVKFKNYKKLLLKEALKINTLSPNTLFLVRPHPLDYTFGWISAYLKIKRCLPYVRLDLSNIEYYRCKRIDFLISFNSNISRYKFFNNKNTKKIQINRNRLLPEFKKNILQFGYYKS